MSQVLFLRSTVAPGTSEYFQKYIEQKTSFKLGKDYFLAMCPERIAEGKSFEELIKLPQIVGTKDFLSFSKASDLFSVLGVKIIPTSFIEAELASCRNSC